MSEPSNESVASAPAGEVQWEAPAPVETAPAPEPTPTPEPVAPAASEPASDFSFGTLENGQHEIRLATGQVYRGATQEEAYSQLARAQVEASRTIQQLRQQQATTPQQQPIQPPQQGMDPNTLAIVDLIAPAFGAKSGQELIETYRAMQDRTSEFSTVAQQNQLQNMALEFTRSTPDFVPTPANADKIEQTLNTMGLAPTLDNLRFVHYALKGQGVYETPPPAPPRATNGQFVPRNSMPMPPQAGTPTPQTQAVDPFSLSDADFDREFAAQMRY